MLGSTLISDCFYTSINFEDIYKIKLSSNEKVLNTFGSFVINLPTNPIYSKDTKLYIQDLHLFKYIDLTVEKPNDIFSYILSNCNNKSLNIIIEDYKFINCRYNNYIRPCTFRFSFLNSNVDF